MLDQTSHHLNGVLVLGRVAAGFFDDHDGLVDLVLRTSECTDVMAIAVGKDTYM
ncbi:Uncharacterised protein [Mycobacteroides abscessus]|nr:Uncharacterised protein [Mycobacteroides abscessus]